MCSAAFASPLLRCLQRRQPHRKQHAKWLSSLTMQPPTTPKVGLPFLRAKEAARLDALLMSDAVGYTLDQLMELAGQAVAHGTHALYPQGRVCVAVGPGNNGGDGLVAARHLRLLGRDVTVALPAPSRGRFAHLEKQCVAHGVPIAHSAVVPTDADVIVDAVFGFSFRPRGERGVDGELAQLIESMDTCGNPVVSVDVPR